MSIKGISVKQIKSKGNIAFYKEFGKIIEIIGIFSEKELEMINSNSSLLEKETVEKFQRVVKELEDERRNNLSKGTKREDL